MATGSDRYEPLRQAEREAQNRRQDKQPPAQENTEKRSDQQHVADQQATWQKQAEIAENGPTRPPESRGHLQRSVVDGPDLPSMNHLGNRLHREFNEGYKKQFDAKQEIEQSRQPTQPSSESRDATSNEEPSRSYADLKQEQAQKSAEQSAQVKEAGKSADAKKPALMFNWDREQGHEHER